MNSFSIVRIDAVGEAVDPSELISAVEGQEVVHSDLLLRIELQDKAQVRQRISEVLHSMRQGVLGAMAPAFYGPVLRAATAVAVGISPVESPRPFTAFAFMCGWYGCEHFSEAELRGIWGAEDQATRVLVRGLPQALVAVDLENERIGPRRGAKR